MQIVKIPVERVGALKGEKQQTKTFLEKHCRVILEIGEDGEIEISGESADEFFAKDVVKAVGRGFEPNTAIKLLKDNNVLKIINLRDFANSRESISRIKSRVIGSEGKTKKIIETDAECDLSIYGYTISIIASLETADMATSAILKLIEGANHSSVYGFLEKARTRLKQNRVKETLGLQ
ncbi:RNA-processing protein [Candidatus Parvarchaeota archaeon]|nr:RNA-processing protein [Candidatus Parvarchaeota archaeon]